MKIAILTLPLHINYGGNLQAYAVQKILKDMGHEVVTLDIVGGNIKRENFLYKQYEVCKYFTVTLLLCFFGKLKTNDIAWPYNTRMRNIMLINRSMRSFIERIIRLSPTLKTENAIKDYVNKEKFDVYVVGSDQVWRPKYGPNINWYFLNFLLDDVKVKRIAISASFGTSDWEYSKEQTAYLKPFAKKFDAISVRELSGVDLCKKYLDVSAIQVLDPTLMLTPQNYATLVDMDKEKTQSMKGAIFSYVLDESNKNQMIIDCISKELKLPVLNFDMENHKYGPYASKKTALKFAPKPMAQWLRGFQDAEFVVTDSFHGSVFSILHHRPFVVVANKSRGLARVETLLKIFGLEDRLVDFVKSSSKEWLLDGIRWESVDTILEEKRRMFNEFLKTALID